MSHSKRSHPTRSRLIGINLIFSENLHKEITNITIIYNYNIF
jgi:hypothetical protein